MGAVENEYSSRPAERENSPSILSTDLRNETDFTKLNS